MIERTCSTCAKQISAQSKTGMCQPCSTRALNADPSFQERRLAGIRRKIKTDPAHVARLRERIIAAGKLPQAVEARRNSMKMCRVWERARGGPPAGSPERIRAGQRQSETKMAWCPRELRDDYRRLVHSKKIPAAQARGLILEQHERNMAKFRRSIGAE